MELGITLLKNHSWAQELAYLVEQLEQGGHPGGEYPYTPYLRKIAREIKADQPKWSNQQIANYITYELKKQENNLTPTQHAAL